MKKTYPCPNGVEDDCGYPACAHAMQCERASQERMTPHNLLAVIDADLGRADIESRWAAYGYTIAAAERAKAEYERIACERLSFDDVDQAITESNLSCGMFPERVRWFFKGWILSANSEVRHGAKDAELD